MKILLSAFACLPNYGSESQIGWSWAASLAAAGHCVYALTRRTNQARIEAYLARLALDPASAEERSAHSRLHFVYVDVPFPRLIPPSTGGLFYLAWQVAALRAARVLLRDHAFDFAQHVSYGALQVPSMLALLGVPLIFGPCGGGQTTPEGLLPLMGADAPKEQLRSRLMALLAWSPLHRLLLRRTALVLATNRETMRLAKSAGCRQVEFMLDTALPENYFAEREPAGERGAAEAESGMLQLLWVGSDRPRKGVRLALDALQKTTRNVHLTLVSGSGTTHMTSLVESRGLGARVTLLGPLQWTEINRVYARADCMLFVSLRDSFGSQLLEAAGQALPIICLDQHGSSDFVTDAMGFRVPPTTAEETATALARAIDRFADLAPEVRSAMSAASLARARTFTWSQRLASALELYQSILPAPASETRADSPTELSATPQVAARQTCQPQHSAPKAPEITELLEI